MRGVQGQGLGGSNATCIQLSSVPGGLTFAMRDGEKPGYQPFNEASALQFWVKNLNSTSVPDLRVSISEFGSVIAPALPRQSTSKHSQLVKIVALCVYLVPAYGVYACPLISSRPWGSS